MLYFEAKRLNSSSFCATFQSFLANLVWGQNYVVRKQCKSLWGKKIFLNYQSLAFPFYSEKAQVSQKSDSFCKSEISLNYNYFTYDTKLFFEVDMLTQCSALSTLKNWTYLRVGRNFNSPSRYAIFTYQYHVFYLEQSVTCHKTFKISLKTS